MAIIPLRAYNHEIEGMIDNGQLDEAVAHCRHILSTYPKHIASYRLLGKAHLEQQRISDATDIFQRVLSSVPDDFIANVGMSIIREDENNLDSAIWHMELAYEVQSTNVAIQDELRRLYGRRDGVQPSRVRLTQGALARMYAKQGLYDQAITELRAAIAEDPNRTDLQLLLAEVYYLTSQRVESVETCANILKKIPFCLEANRILAVSLPDANSSDAAKNYRQVVISMDPYYAFASSEAMSSDDVPDNAVNIERLDWKSGIQAPQTQAQPNWATSLGIAMDKPTDESVPDWLKSAAAPAPAPTGEKPGSGISPFIWDNQEGEQGTGDAAKPGGEIPDWMQDAGWQPASGEAAPPPEELKPEEPVFPVAESGELEKAEIPEWLRGIAPEGVLSEEGQAEKPAEGDLSTPWLEQRQPGPTDSIIQWLEDNKPEKPRSRPDREEATSQLPEDEVPDWLKDMEPSQTGTATPSASTPPTPAFTIEPTALDDSAFSQQPDAKLTSFEGSAGLGEEAPHTQPEGVTPEPQESSEAESTDEIPDWLRELAEEPEATKEAVPAGQEATPEIPSEEPLEPIAEVPPAIEETPQTELPAEAVPSIEAAAFTVELPVSEAPTTAEEHPTAEFATTTNEGLASTEAPAGAEIPASEALPATETPAVTEEQPVVEEIPAAEASAIIEEHPVSEELPSVEEIPPVEEVPAVEAPVVPAELPTTEIPPTPINEEVPTVETPVTEEVPPAEPVVAEFPAVEAPPAAEETLPIAPPAEIEPVEAAEAPAIPEEPTKSEEISAAEVEGIIPEIPMVPEELPTMELPIEAKPAPGMELPPVPAGQPEVKPPIQVEGEPEAIAWLEDLAAEQSAKEESLPTPTEGGEIAPPEWVKLEAEPPTDETVKIEGKPPEAIVPPAEGVPGWIKGLGEEPESAPSPEEAVTPEAEVPPTGELPAWLRELEEPEPEKEEAAPAEAGSGWKADELPAWLKELTEGEPTTEEPAPVEAPAGQEAPVASTTPAEEWTTESTPPAGIKTEALEEPVEEKGLESAAVEEPLQKEAVAPIEEPAGAPEVPLDTFKAVSEANQAALNEARNAVTQGQPAQAVEHYSGLVKKNYHLDEIIKDLQDALYRFPVNIEMWVTLGEAHFRMDDLQAALDAYTKAEELIR